MQATTNCLHYVISDRLLAPISITQLSPRLRLLFEFKRGQLGNAGGEAFQEGDEAWQGEDSMGAARGS
jgi:hypothetical protein